MTQYGLLIDYEFCSGCQSCEVSCKEEHGYPVGQWGIRVLEDGPWLVENGKYNWNKIPVPTDLCDLCADRTAAGREPICVHHCLADCMSYGPVSELAEKLGSKTKQTLWVPQYKPWEARGEFVSKGSGSNYEHDTSDIVIEEITATISVHRGSDGGEGLEDIVKSQQQGEDFNDANVLVHDYDQGDK